MTDGEAVVMVQAVTVRYGARVALDRASFSVGRGATVGLLGRNGAGKSSAVRCVLGQQLPEHGRVLLFGQDVWRDRQQLMQRVGVVPEAPDLPLEMTADQLSGLCSALYRRWDRAAVRERLERLAVPRQVPSARLSKGQRAQLALALALGHGPELLVLDDPTLGLDVIARRDFFREVIAELAGAGMSILMTSHDLGGVERIADKVVILDGGKVIVDDTLDSVKSDLRCLPDGAASLEEIFTALVEERADQQVVSS
jgi:ABC-2 type transport system ATP-binding protein